MKLSGIAHIFFDLDHTLWNFERNSGLTFQYILEKHKIPVAVDDFLKVYSPINFDFWRLFRNNEISKETLRYGRLKNTFDQLEVELDDDSINRLSIDYITHLADHNHLFDGALDLLEYLKPKYQLHIITNGFEEVQHKKLENSKIIDYFDVIVTSDLVGVKKPDPKIFDYALKTANAQPQESLMVGDNYEADVLGANDCGLKSIFYDIHNTKVPQNQLRARNLFEIKTFL